MATTVGFNVTKTSATGGGFIYQFTSVDANAIAGGWNITSNAFDSVDDWSGIQEPFIQEIIRQLRQL